MIEHHPDRTASARELGAASFRLPQRFQLNHFLTILTVTEGELFRTRSMTFTRHTHTYIRIRDVTEAAGFPGRTLRFSQTHGRPNRLMELCKGRLASVRPVAVPETTARAENSPLSPYWRPSKLRCAPQRGVS